MANRTRDDDYKFMQIVDAMACLNQRVNLIGIVIEASLPKHSKGTDYFCSIKLIDQSRTSPGISVTVFAEAMEKLPQIESIGDIILLTRVVMKINGNCSDVCATYLKKYSSFALFEGCNDVPYQVSPKFRAREQDKKIVAGLRKWFTSQKIEADLNDLSPLKEMKEGEHINLLGKVLHCCEVTKDDWMLFVWDGTDTPPAPIEAKLEDEMEDPLPLQSEPSPLSRDTLCTFPPVGSVLRMVTDRGNKKIGINFLKPNKWVKVVQVKCEVHAGLWRAVLMPSSKLYYLPDDDNLILERERSYNERVTSKLKRMPLSSFPGPSLITETDYTDVPFVTLMNVLIHPEVTFKFNCVVRVVAAFPWRVEDFCNPQGIYRVRLTLEDPTARIYAFLYAEDGVQFFGSRNTVDELTRKMNALLGISKSDGCRKAVSRNPPWVQCCLKSYYIDKADIWGSRNYRIFATTLVG
ncbi:Protection of telomeres protein 1a [Forsythia ovata]|uniref:Protection of telomeres protein 1a n=1 Tax=Forsythia ovata TaxID=205694 RepID=A0ABD1WYN2_9LAMI